jgi:hypothetical protein
MIESTISSIDFNACVKNEVSACRYADSIAGKRGGIDFVESNFLIYPHRASRQRKPGADKVTARYFLLFLASLPRRFFTQS